MRKHGIFLLLLVSLLAILPASTLAADPSGADNPADLDGIMNSVNYI